MINEDYKTFDTLFTKNIFQNNDHFFTKNFFEQFSNNLDKLKEFKNIFILGSNPGNNYYSNLLQFLPRILFIKKNNIKIAIHRNSSTKFKELINLILKDKGIKFSFVYLDDGFYKFTNCEIPQFFNLKKNIQILKKLLIPKNKSSQDKKIYVTRRFIMKNL